MYRKRSSAGVELARVKRAIRKCEARGHFEHAIAQQLRRELDAWVRSKQKLFGRAAATLKLRQMAKDLQQMARIADRHDALAAAEAWIETRFDQGL